MTDDRLDRRINWSYRGMFLLLGLILVIVAWTLPKLSNISAGQTEEGQQLERQNTLLVEQNEQLRELVDRQRTQDAQRGQSLQEAIDKVEILLVDFFAAHDRNVALKLNEMLQRIAVLVDRPAPAPIPTAAPTTYRPTTSPTTSAPSTPVTTVAPRPTTTTTTTTTTPAQKRCAVQPTLPQC